MEHISIIPETITKIGGLAITNTLFTSWLVVLLIVFLAWLVGRKISEVPNALQNGVELIFEKMFDFFETVAGTREKAEKFFPLVATVFIFILTANWIGILPGMGSIGFHRGEEFIPIFRSINSDLNMTLAIALLVVVAAHIFGVIGIGMKGHISKFLSFKSPMAFFTGILELIGEFSRILSFSFRLFGNVFAGEVLLVIIGSLIPYVAPVPFLGMELFVGFIQALILSTFTEAHAEH